MSDRSSTFSKRDKRGLIVSLIVLSILIVIGQLSERSHRGYEAYSKAANILSPLIQKGREHLSMSDRDAIDEAIRLLNESIRIDSKNAHAFCFRGEANYLRSFEDDAVLDFDTAIRLNPDYYGAYQDLGIMYVEIHQPEDAIAPLKKAIELHSNNDVAESWLKKARADLDEQRRIDAPYQPSAEQ